MTTQVSEPHDRKPGVALHRIATNGTELNVAVAGAVPGRLGAVGEPGVGSPVLLLHGWPHTWQVWSAVLPRLAAGRLVIAPDLRGLGASARATDGYDLHTLAADLVGVLDALELPSADVIAIDAGTPVAFMLALREPERVRRLVLTEALLGRLPGSESAFGGGPPWWFGFHGVAGLAETVLVGHEADYVDHFLATGTLGRGIAPEIRDAFVDAYTGSEALRCGFEYYRAMPANAEQIAAAVAADRLRVPTMAIGAAAVGDALRRQLEPITDDLVGHVLDDCGHIIPLDGPDAFLDLVLPFLT